MSKVKKSIFLLLVIILSCSVVSAYELDENGRLTKVEVSYLNQETSTMDLYEHESGIRTYIKYIDLTHQVNGSEQRYYAYCIDYAKQPVPSGTTIDVKEISNSTKFAKYKEGLYYILNNQHSSQSESRENYFINQAAIWWYMDKVDGVADSVDGQTKANFKTGDYYQTSIAKELATNAYKYDQSNILEKNITLSLNPSSLTFTKNDEILVSNAISYSTNGTISSISVNNGQYSDNNSKITIAIPYTGNYDSAKLTVEATKNNADLYVYDGDLGQELVLEKYYTVSQKMKKSITGNYTVTNITKTDATGDKELPGAKLRLCKYITLTDVSLSHDELEALNIKNCEESLNNSLIIEEWISTDTAHKIEGLESGKKYVLTEVLAPDGYEVAPSIVFTINDEGSVTEVIIKDQTKKIPAPDTGVKDIIIFGLLFIALCGSGIYYCKKKNIFIK